MTATRRHAPRTPPLPGLAAPLQQVDRTLVIEKGRRLIYFGGCDYFRRSSDPRVIAAVHEGLDRHGLNVAASRKTTGNHPLYRKLEMALARFFRFPSALLVSSGYMTNLCVAQALAGQFTHVLADERSHGSILDALRWIDCPVLLFPHRDAAAAAARAAQCGRRARLLLATDGLFAHSGELAPADQYLRLLPRSARLLLDDTHGAGTLGRSGGGTVEYLQLDRQRVIQTITLSKAFGVYGGAILSDHAVSDRIVGLSRFFTGNTPLPLPLVQGALRSLELTGQDTRARRRLVFHTSYVKAALREAGWAINDGPGPIVPIHPQSPKESARLSRALRRAGIHPPLIHYGTTAGAAYFRFVISSEHTPEHLARLIQALGTAPAPTA